MSKILDLIGFGFIGGTIYSFIGMIDHELRWPVFLGLRCRSPLHNTIAQMAKKEKKSDVLNFQENQCVVELKDIGRSIKDLFAQIVNVSRSKAVVERFR